MVDKFRTHDDSLFNVNNTISTLRTSINDNSIQIKNGKKEYDGLLERIEKLETDTVLAKDEMEQKMDSLNMQINGVKEISVPRKAFEDHTNTMRDELFTDLKSNEEEVKKLALRVIDLEKKAPQIKENRSLIDDLMEKTDHMEGDIDKNRSDIFVNRGSIEQSIS